MKKEKNRRKENKDMMSIQDFLGGGVIRLKQVNGRLVPDRTPAEEVEARKAMRRYLLGPVMPWLIPSARPDIVRGRVVY